MTKLFKSGCYTFLRREETFEDKGCKRLHKDEEVLRRELEYLEEVALECETPMT